MAGARIEIEVDDEAVLSVLQRAVDGLDDDGLALLLRAIGEHLLESTRERAAQEIDPAGNKWRALEPTYAKWKAKKRPGVPILKFDNHMLGDQLSYQVDGQTLLLGTNAIYGAIHQFGGKIKHASYGRLRDKAIIPEHEVEMHARPFLGLSDDDADWMQETILDYLGSLFGDDSGPEAPAP